MHGDVLAKTVDALVNTSCVTETTIAVITATKTQRPVKLAVSYTVF